MSELRKLQKDIRKWALKTFPMQPSRAKAKHLVKEAGELVKKPSDRMEQADVLILLLEVCSLTGVSANKLVKNARKKLNICKKRKWGKPDRHGVIQHIKRKR